MLGAIIGDTVGSVYEFNNYRRKDFPLISRKSEPTDDSIMTLAVAECIQKRYQNNREMIIKTFKKWGRKYPNAGYGGRFYNWIFSDETASYRSYGNGAAMRISPVGWYARSESEVKEMSKAFTEVTHSHPEGLKGAEVTAMCIYYAKIGKSKEFIKNYVSKYYNLDFNYEELRKNYWFNETCQNTVPQAIYCFLISRDFEDCLRTTISIGGDCDTTAAISCAIAEAYYKDINIDLINEIMKIIQKFDIDECIKKILNNFLNYKAFDLVNCEEINDDTKIIGFENNEGENTILSFIHSTSIKPLLEYIVSLKNKNNNQFNFCNYYSNLQEEEKMIMRTETIGDLNEIITKSNNCILFKSHEDAINYLKCNYDLNNVFLSDLFNKEYYK